MKFITLTYEQKTGDGGVRDGCFMADTRTKKN